MNKSAYTFTILFYISIASFSCHAFSRNHLSSRIPKQCLEIFTSKNIAIRKTLKEKMPSLTDSSRLGDTARSLFIRFGPKNKKGISWAINGSKVNIGTKTIIDAAQYGNLAALEAIQEKGTWLNVVDEYGNTPLHYASSYTKDKDVINFLIHIGKIPVNRKNKDGITAFMYAAEAGNLEALKTLKDNGANGKLRNIYEEDALHYASASSPNMGVIKWLIHDVGLRVNARGYYGKTPYIYAAQYGNLPALKVLIEEKVLYTTDLYSENILHYAARYRGHSSDLIEWIIDNTNIPIDSKGYNGETPFIWAAEFGNTLNLAILKAKGANVNATNENGYNALHYAAALSSEGKGIRWLIKEGKIPLEAKGRWQKTAFLLAAEYGNLATLEILQREGADLGAMDENGWNALHYAVFYEADLKVIDWLIEQANIPIDSKEADQKTPFLLAAKKRNLAILRELSQKGADVNARDKWGYGAINYSLVGGDHYTNWLINVCGVKNKQSAWFSLKQRWLN